MSSIGSVGGGVMPMQGPGRGPSRPDVGRMAEDLFSRLDTSGRGVLQKSDLQAAFDTVSSGTSAGGGNASVDEVFSALDANTDGQVTKQEFADSLRSLQSALESQFQDSRMQQARAEGGFGGGGGMAPPPPPPPSAGGAGFTRDELSSQLEEIGDGDGTRSELISRIVENFDAADTDGDGKVSFQEAMTFDQSGDASGTSTKAAVSSAMRNRGEGASDAASSEARILMQVMRLSQAYGTEITATGTASTVSVSA